MALQKQFVQGWTKAFIDVVLAQVLHAVAGISLFGVEPFAGLQAWADELMQQASEAFSTAQDAQLSANNAQAGVQTVTDGIATAAGSSTTTGNDPSTVETNIGTIVASVDSKPGLNLIPDGSPLYRTFSGNAEVTFDRIHLKYLPATTSGSTTPGATGLTNASTTPNHSHTSANHSHSMPLNVVPDYQPAGNGANYTEISYFEVSRDRPGVSAVVSGTGNNITLAGIGAMYLGVYKVDIATGNLTLVAQTSDIHSSVSPNDELTFTLTSTFDALKGEVYGYAVLQVTGLFQTCNSLLCLNFYPVGAPSGFFPSALHSTYRTSRSTLASTIPNSALTYSQTMMLYGGFL